MKLRVLILSLYLSLFSITGMARVLFPIDNHFSQAYLFDQFWRYTYSSSNQNLGYSILLPTYVKPVSTEPVPIQGVGLTEIGSYQTIKDAPYIEVTVYYESVAEDIEPSLWLKDKLSLIDEQLLEQREIISYDGIHYLDVLTTKTEADKTILSRNVVYKREQIYFFVQVSSYADQYIQLAETIQLITSRFTFPELN